MDDIGEVIADSILEWFSRPGHLHEIERLKAAGLKFSMEEETVRTSSALEGLTIVITGNFSVSRDEIKAMIVNNGGKNSSSVSGKTSFLLAGEKPGPEKIKKAQNTGVEIIDEARFRAMLAVSDSRDSSSEAASEPEIAGETRETGRSGSGNDEPFQPTLF